MEAIALAPPAKKRLRKIPESLIFEMIDGQPIYRRGYRSVLNGSKKIEDIMGSSTLQSEIVFYLMRMLIGHFDDEHFTIHTNEAGLHLGSRNNLAGDILVYERSVMTSDKISVAYSDVAPKFAFEIDIKIEPERLGDLEYIEKKSQKLLDFGVEKLFWIFSRAQKVLVFEKGKSEWRAFDWSQNVEVDHSLTINIGEHLRRKGISVG